MTVLLRPAGFADEPFLRALYATTRADELAGVCWTNGERDQFLDLQFRAQSRDYTARFPQATHDIIVLAGEPVGRIWVNRDPLEVRLIDLALLPDHQNTRIGTSLVKGLQASAAPSGTPLRHMVVKENLDALRFYGRLGFEVTSEITSHFQMEWRRASE